MVNRSTSAQVARSAERDRVVDALGDWSVGTGPLYRLLARAMTSAIERRASSLRGERLPSERALAAAVDVSRGVVVAAFDELVAAGVIERRQGSGTFVGGSPDIGLPPGREGSALVGRLVEGPGSAVIDLSISVLHEARGLPDVQVGRDEVSVAGADSPWGLPSCATGWPERLTAIGLPTDGRPGRDHHRCPAGDQHRRGLLGPSG